MFNQSGLLKKSKMDENILPFVSFTVSLSQTSDNNLRQSIKLLTPKP